MNTKLVFGIIFTVGLVIGSVIRSYGRRLARQNEIKERRGDVLGLTVASLWGVSGVAALFWAYSPWLDFADYPMPLWLRWVGVPIFAYGIWMLWLSHRDLGRSFSVTLEIADEQKLITDGIFKHIRHPMYAAHLLWSIGQALMIPNWFGGALALAAMVATCFLRIPPEERMMLDTFGDEYRQYMKRTGRILPRFSPDAGAE